MILSLCIFVTINIILIINFNKFSKLINLYDIPDHKLKLHKKKISLAGGTIIITNIFLLIFLDFIFKNGLIEFFNSGQELFSFILILSAFYLLGIYDDKYKLKPNIKFFFIFLISFLYVIINNNILINNFSFSIYDHRIFLHNYSIPFTVFCLVILINSLNFFDGVNGQLLIFFLVIFSYLLIKTLRLEFYLFIIIIIIFCLILNLKNKMFLGDNGVYVMSILLSTSIIYEHNTYKEFIYVDEIFFLLLLPGIDLLRLTIFRLIHRKNPFYGDRNHIQHLLLNRFSLLNTNIYLILLSILPIFLYNILNQNFYAVFSIFLVIYSLLIKNLLNDI